MKTSFRTYYSLYMIEDKDKYTVKLIQCQSYTFFFFYDLISTASVLYISIATCILVLEFNKTEVRSSKGFRQHRGRI